MMGNMAFINKFINHLQLARNDGLQLHIFARFNCLALEEVLIQQSSVLANILFCMGVAHPFHAKQKLTKTSEEHGLTAYTNRRVKLMINVIQRI